VVLLVGKDETRMPAHRLLLAVASPVLAKLLYPESKDKVVDPKSWPAELKLPDIEADVATLLLGAIYENEVELDEDIVSRAYAAAKTYEVPCLRFACSSYLASDITMDNVFSLLHSLPKEDSGVVAPFFRLHASDLFDSKEWLHVDESLVFALVSGDVLAATELQLFNACAAWANAQCVAQSIEPTPENRRKLLHRILPLIRFPLLTAQNFATEVVPTQLLESEDQIFLFQFFYGHKDLKSLKFESKPRLTKPKEGSAVATVTTVPLDDGIGLAGMAIVGGAPAPAPEPEEEADMGFSLFD